MPSRRILTLVAVAAVFVGLVVATSMGGGGGGTHAMPDGRTMQGDAMDR
jgi:hypothetical protein